MPRRPRGSYTTSFFHIIVQGIAKEEIFNTKEKSKQYIFLLKKYLSQYDIYIMSYCIMNNHAHILVNISGIEKLSEAMHKINVIYSRYYNKEEDRVGYVFRNRYLSEPIKDQGHLLMCIAYIHNNPVKAKIAETPQEYKYSSYNDYIEQNGIYNLKIIKIIFGDIKDYRTTYERMHKIRQKSFIEVYERKDDYIKEKVKEFCNKKNVSIEEMKKDINILKEFMYEMNNKNKISIRKIAKILNINREILRKNIK